MKQKIVSTWEFTKKIVVVFSDNGVTSKSAALAFYTFF